MKVPEHIQQAIQAYYAERGSPQHIADLEAWLREDEAHVRVFAEHGLVEWQLLCEQAKQEATAILEVIREAEADPGDSAAAQALAELYNLHREGLNQPISLEAHRLSSHSKDIGPSRRTVIKARLILAGSFAAILAIAGLVGVLLSALAEPEPQVAQDSPAAQQTVRVVAMLTAATDAHWQTSDGEPITLTVGDGLDSGTLLTLAEGQAELTTNQGAVATLQAPCEVELVDHDNALWLHAGKLVGRVDNPEAAGFTVHTKHMDVTDLGTRFGVCIDEAGNTLARVFMGSVEVTPSASTRDRLEDQLLITGQAFAVDHAGNQAQPDIFAADTFARLDDTQPTAEPDAAQTRWVAKGRYIGNDPASWPRSQHAHVFEELSGYRLTRDLDLTLHAPGTYRHFQGNATRTLKAGTVVRSYILIYNPGAAGGQASIDGSVQFEGEVLGLITDKRHWDAFATSVADPVFDPPDNGRFIIDGAAFQDPDRLAISEDRRQLSFHLFVKQGRMDAVRVIVAEPAGEQQP